MNIINHCEIVEKTSLDIVGLRLRPWRLPPGSGLRASLLTANLRGAHPRHGGGGFSGQVG